MRIARLQIKKFRGIRDADIQFGQTSVLIGPNSVGKTTILEALALILGRDRMVRSLTEHDFYGSNPAPADRIKIIASIAGFEGNDPEKHPEWFNIRRGAVPKWLNTETGVVSPTKSGKTDELVCEIAVQARFDQDTLEVETCRYFYEDDSNEDVFVDDTVTLVPNSLIQEVGLFFIPASRSWDRMISFGSELFRRVISSEEGLPSESIIAERDRLRNPSDPLEANTRLKPIIDEVNKEICALFGEGNDVRLRITATDSSGVLESVIPHFRNREGIIVPAKRQGSGLLSLQSLFLLLHFGQRRVDGGKGFCLALEEPELHLQPATQRKVLRRLRSLSSQVIVSTHSPLVAGFAEPTELLTVRGEGGTVTASPMLSEPLSAKSPNALRTLFQLRRVELAGALMCDIVLVPEGIFDCEWMSLFIRLAELQPEAQAAGTQFTSSIGLVPTHDSAVVATCQSLMNAHPVALVDGDASGQAYAAELAEPKSGAAKVLRWPDQWTMEDVVGWIIKPAHTKVIDTLKEEIELAPVSLDELIARLKNDKKSDPLHLKGDRVAYEAIAQAIGEQPACISRIAELLDGVALAASGKPTPRFLLSSIGQPKILIFRP